MKLPKEILVGPHLYRVRTGRKAKLHLLANGNDGECSQAQATIYITPDATPSVQAELLLHELLHAAWDQTSQRCLDDNQEEAVVTSLAPILLTMLRANPDLVRVLTGATS